jgi:hypothetical protein
MVYDVSISEIPANFYGIFAHLACHAAVKRDSVARTRHNVDEAFPALDGPHDLFANRGSQVQEDHSDGGPDEHQIPRRPESLLLENR